MTRFDAWYCCCQFEEHNINSTDVSEQDIDCKLWFLAWCIVGGLTYAFDLGRLHLTGQQTLHVYVDFCACASVYCIASVYILIRVFFWFYFFYASISTHSFILMSYSHTTWEDLLSWYMLIAVNVECEKVLNCVAKKRFRLGRWCQISAPYRSVFGGFSGGSNFRSGWRI